MSAATASAASPSLLHRISTALYYEDPRAAIDWLCTAFGFEVRLLVEGDGGRIEHSELTYGEGMRIGNRSRSAGELSHQQSMVEQMPKLP